MGSNPRSFARETHALPIRPLCQVYVVDVLLKQARCRLLRLELYSDKCALSTPFSLCNGERALQRLAKEHNLKLYAPVYGEPYLVIWGTILDYVVSESHQ